MDTQRRTMTMIGAAAVLLMAGWCAYNLLAGWPSQYKGGILYDRMVQEHLTGSLLQAAAYLAAPLLAFLYQAFGYDLVVGKSPTPSRRKLGGILLVVATIVAAAMATLTGAGWLIQVMMEAPTH